MPAAVIFDCDGVLVDSEIIGQRVELACLAEIGLVYEPDDYAARYLGRGGGEYHAALSEDHQRRLGRPLPGDFLDTLYKRLWAAIDADLTAIDGVHGAVADLKNPKAVASGSAAASLEKKLRKVALFETFAPHIYSSQLVARGKPAPDIFLHAAQKLAVDPVHCIAVEDSANGVRAARAAGMRVIGFTGGGHCGTGHGAGLQAAGAEHVVEHMDQLLSVLGRMS